MYAPEEVPLGSAQDADKNYRRGAKDEAREGGEVTVR